jgi:hypothetical protein
LTYPAAAAFTIDHMHSGRSVNGVIFWLLAAVVGIHQLLVPRRRAGHVAIALLSLFGVVEMARFYRDYFGPYQTRARLWFDADRAEAIESCFEYTGTNETLYISGSVFDLQLLKGNIVDMPVDPDFHYYPTVLFFGKIPPGDYQRQGIPRDRVQLYDGSAPRPGLLLRRSLLAMWDTGLARYRFSHNTEPLPPQAYLVKTLACPSPGRYEIYRVP